MWSGMSGHAQSAVKLLIVKELSDYVTILHTDIN